MADNWRTRAKPIQSGGDFRSRAIKADFQVADPAINEGLEYLDPSQGPSLEAALQGAGQAATLGYLPEAQAAVAAGLDSELDYPQALEQMRAREERLSAESPGSYGTGAVAGSLALPLPGSAAISKGPALLRALKASAQGAGVGLAMNPGEGGTIEDRLENAALGATVGGVAQGALGAVERIPPALKKLRENLALRTAGAMKTQVKEVMKKGTAPKLEKFMEKEGMLGLLSNAEDVLEKSTAIADESGGQLGQLYDELQAQSTKAIKRPAATDIADRFMAKATTEYGKGKAGGQQALAAVETELANLTALGPDSSLQELLQYRMSLDDAIKYNKTYSESPMTQKALRDLRNFVQGDIDAHAQELGQAAGKQYMPLLKDLKERFSNAKTLQNISENRVSSDRAKSMMLNIGVGGGLGAAYGGSRGGAEGGLEGAALGTLGLMGARKFGPALLYKAAKVAGPAAATAAKLPPRAITNPWLLMNEQEKY